MKRPLYGRGQQAETGAAVVSFGDPVARGEGVAEDGAGTSPPSSVDTVSQPGFSERLRNWQCEIADKIGLDFCTCCGRWHRKSRMGHLDGLCRHCAAFTLVDRALRQLSDADWEEIL